MFLPGGAGVGVDLVPSRFSRRQHLSKRLTIHSYPNSPAFFLTASHLPSYKIRTVFRQFLPLVRWRFFFLSRVTFELLWNSQRSFLVMARASPPAPEMTFCQACGFLQSELSASAGLCRRQNKRCKGRNIGDKSARPFSFDN